MNAVSQAGRCRSCRQSLLTAPSWRRSSVLSSARRGYAAPAAAAKEPESFRLMGQPLPQTHPHLFRSPQELTPGIPYEEYEQRRRNLMARLPDNALVICCGGRLQYMSQRIFYKFRQSTNFAYLTGFHEPDAAVVLRKDSSPRGFSMRLFCQPADKYRERWDGARTGVQGAVDVFGADEAEDVEGLARYLTSVLPTVNSTVYVDLPPHFQRSSSTTAAARVAKKSSKSIINMLSETAPPTTPMDFFRLGRRKDEGEAVMALLTGKQAKETKSLNWEVERLRITKSPNELTLMRKAAELSSEAHAQVMRFTRPGMSEAALVAHFEYICSLGGADRLAYVPVCGSGERAQTIHYTTNNQLAPAGGLVLIDAGCEFNGYASDITRTFPVSGVFSQPQKDLYQAVLNVTRACTKLCRENNRLSMQALHNESNKLLKEELRQLGFNNLLTTLDDVYPHFLSHPLGADLHDTPGFARSELIRAGQVLTIEPGVYIPDTSNMPKHFRGMAVRVEDEVAVGMDDYTVLSANCPAQIADVEATCLNKLENPLQLPFRP